MKVLDAVEAAAFLKMSAYTVRQKAHQGIIPGKKPGRSWVFIEEHLAEWVSGRYPDPRELHVIDTIKSEVKQCRSTSAARLGISKSQPKMADEYSNLLELKSNVKHRNSTTK